MNVASPPRIAKPRRSPRSDASLRVDRRRLADLLPAQGEWTVDDYREHAVFALGSVVSSPLMTGLAVEVDDVLDPQ